MSEIQKNINRTGVNNPMFELTGENNHLFGLSHSIASKAKMSEAKGTTIFIYSKLITKYL